MTKNLKEEDFDGYVGWHENKGAWLDSLGRTEVAAWYKLQASSITPYPQEKLKEMGFRVRPVKLLFLDETSDD